MKNLSAMLVLAMFGCGGEDFTDVIGNVDEGGSGPSSSSEGGSDVGGSDQGGNDVGGSGEGGNGEGGSACVGASTCQSMQLECGSFVDECGNTVECQDTCVAPFTCGGGGSSTKCGCSPKSCLTQSKNCGLVDDGCGNLMDCGGCGDDPNVTCGGAKPNADGTPAVGEENVCGGGCVLVSSYKCTALGYPTYQIRCSNNEINPTGDCVHENFYDIWCCASKP